MYIINIDFKIDKSLTTNVSNLLRKGSKSRMKPKYANSLERFEDYAQDAYNFKEIKDSYNKLRANGVKSKFDRESINAGSKR